MRQALLHVVILLAHVHFGSPFDVKNTNPIHTLLLCRHGDSIWNGGEPGTYETFTGWTDVGLSKKGMQEAKNTGEQVSAYSFGIDACFTSILNRAQLTAHYCLWAFAEKPCGMEPRKYVSDYRLNERHYGALQGYVKQQVEDGKYGHDPADVKKWRRSWYVVPPLLDDDDPRRIDEVRKYAGVCGGKDNVPRGESLEQVAKNRIRPFLDEVLTPIMDEAAKSKGSGTGIVVAHANSLRALIGVLCEVEKDPTALSKLEALRIQTGVPLVLKFQQRLDGSYQVCDLP
jgi:2,3-bisphosphoglycerate-dependent phosphoglycerate mutase